MSLSLSTNNYNLLTTQTAYKNPTIDSGLNSGALFNGMGDDFLDPDKILKDIDRFTGSIKPVQSNTLTGQFTPRDPYGKFADSERVLSRTNNTINQIFSANYGKNLNYNIPVLPGSYIQAIPDLGTNPDAAFITLSTNWFGQNIQSPGQVNNPLNYNPVQWQNPTSNNILLGTMQAQDSILSGLGLQYPSLNPFANQLNAFTGTNTAYTQPYGLSGSQPLQSYGNQVDLMSTMAQQMGSVMSEMFQQLVQMQ